MNEIEELHARLETWPTIKDENGIIWIIGVNDFCTVNQQMWSLIDEMEEDRKEMELDEDSKDTLESDDTDDAPDMVPRKVYPRRRQRSKHPIKSSRNDLLRKTHRDIYAPANRFIKRVHCSIRTGAGVKLCEDTLNVIWPPSKLTRVNIDKHSTPFAIVALVLLSKKPSVNVASVTEKSPL